MWFQSKIMNAGQSKSKICCVRPLDVNKSLDNLKHTPAIFETKLLRQNTLEKLDKCSFPHFICQTCKINFLQKRHCQMDVKSPQNVTELGRFDRYSGFRSALMFLADRVSSVIVSLSFWH